MIAGTTETGTTEAEMLLRSVPPIHRARDYRLYSRDGRRLLDLYQADGTALLGHRPPRLAHTIKQRLSQGLTAALPSNYEAHTLHTLRRLQRRLFPTHRRIEIYGNRERACAAIARIRGRATDWATLYDPALAHEPAPAGAMADNNAGHSSAAGGGAIALWRPCVPLPTASVLLPIVPFPAHWAPQIICIQAETESAYSELLAPLLLSGLRVSLKNLERALDGDYNPLAGKNRSDLVHPPELFDGYGLELWRRRGPYLTITCRAQDYAVLFATFLESGFLIHPRFPGPTILPLVCPHSELKRFANLSQSAYNRL